MAKPVTIHTIESLMDRTIEVGDCAEWQGYFAGKTAAPNVYHNGQMIAVRKLIAALSGRDDVESIPYWSASCGNPLCVHPDHIVGRSNARHFSHMGKKVDHQSPSRVAKLQEFGRQRAIAKLTQDKADAIRLDTRTGPEIAQEYGINRSLVSKIRRGLSWRPVSAAVNPWGGLMR